MGYLVEAIINYVVLLGWSPDTNQEIFSLDELEKVFNIKGISKSPAVFDMSKLTWMNGEYIKKLPAEKFHEFIKKHYEGLVTNKNIDLLKISKLLQNRTDILQLLPQVLTFSINSLIMI
jgi:glutamyl-tRNA synthetase